MKVSYRPIKTTPHLFSLVLLLCSVAGSMHAAVKDDPDFAKIVQPFVAGKERDGRVIVHHGVCVRDDPGIASLTATSELRMKVRTAQDTGLQVIVGTRKPGGDFAGNFEFTELTCPRSGDDEWRELRVPVSQLRSITPEYAASADDLIADFIILNSFTNSAGLEVAGLSIIPIP